MVAGPSTMMLAERPALVIAQSWSLLRSSQRVIAAELVGEIGDGDQQCVLIGGDELAFRQETLDIAEEGNLLGRGWRSL